MTRSWQEVPQFVLRRDVDATRLESWRASARAQARRGERQPHRPAREALRRGAAPASARELVLAATARSSRRRDQRRDRRRDRRRARRAGRPRRRPPRASPRSRAAAHRARRGARERQLRPADVQGGTFTISNLGMYGVDCVPGDRQRAAGRDPRRRPDPRAAGRRRTARSSRARACVLSLSFDHRVVDGARGAEFLDTLADADRGARRTRRLALGRLCRTATGRPHELELRRHRSPRPALQPPDRADPARREARVRVRVDLRLACPLAGVVPRRWRSSRTARRRSSSATWSRTRERASRRCLRAPTRRCTTSRTAA